MKALNFVFLTTCSIAISALSTGATPVPNVPRNSEARGDQVAAWWDSYLNSAASRKQLGPEDIWRSSREELSQHLDAFHQRLNHLDYLKRWVLSNELTRSALTTEQLKTLATPFLPWKDKTLSKGFVNRNQLNNWLREEGSLVTRVELVLHDVATFLPDLRHP